MTAEPDLPGGPRKPWQRWGTNTKRIAAAAAVAIAIAGGGAVALAATGDEDGGRGGPGGRMPGGSGQYGSPGPPGAPGADGPGRGGPVARALPGALHGEFVAKDGDAFVTYAMQTGEITAIDDDSVTLRSEDDYSREYRLGDVDPQGLQVGDDARVLAKVDGDTATVVRIGPGRSPDGNPHEGGPMRRGGR